jgi:hypothetical protein
MESARAYDLMLTRIEQLEQRVNKLEREKLKLPISEVDEKVENKKRSKSGGRVGTVG